MVRKAARWVPWMHDLCSLCGRNSTTWPVMQAACSTGRAPEPAQLASLHFAQCQAWSQEELRQQHTASTWRFGAWLHYPLRAAARGTCRFLGSLRQQVAMALDQMPSKMVKQQRCFQVPKAALAAGVTRQVQLAVVAAARGAVRDLQSDSPAPVAWQYYWAESCLQQLQQRSCRQNQRCHCYHQED